MDNHINNTPTYVNLKEFGRLFEVLGNSTEKAIGYMISHIDSNNMHIGTIRGTAKNAGASSSSVMEAVKILTNEKEGKIPFFVKKGQSVYKITPKILAE